MRIPAVILSLSSLAVGLFAQQPVPAAPDASEHTIQFITVDDDVKLEVLDWGGSGRPLVLLTGLGDTAHRFDRFAPKLTGTYHVYAITRRGFGASSVPDSGYSADRLGDDVLAVINALKLERPVLVGHSIAGEELSSVGSRHPEKVAGLIYLDAAYAYAYYDPSLGDLTIDHQELRKQLDEFGRVPLKQLAPQLLDTLSRFERSVQRQLKAIQTMPVENSTSQTLPVVPSAEDAIMAGQQKFTSIPVPVLAIYALPHNFGPAIENNPALRTAYEALDAIQEAQAKAFENGIPSARVVRFPNASHYVFLSREADVLREINTFLRNLP
jgi:pimeloyl-ACP methyl ester carboxylesterase